MSEAIEEGKRLKLRLRCARVKGDQSRGIGFKSHVRLTLYLEHILHKIIYDI